MEFKGTKEKIHAIEYAGVIFMQDTEFYEDQEECNILNMDYVGREVAESNGKLFECAYEMLEALIHIEKYVTRSLTLSNHSENDIDLILRKVRPVIKKATE